MDSNRAAVIAPITAMKNISSYDTAAVQYAYHEPAIKAEAAPATNKARLDGRLVVFFCESFLVPQRTMVALVKPIVEIWIADTIMYFGSE